MKPIPLIRSDGALGFVEFLADAGVPTERLWARTGLPPRALFEPDRLIPLQLANRFIQDAATDQGLPDLGLRVARRSGLERGGGKFGARVRRAPTLYKAFHTACVTVSTHNSGARYWLVEEGASVRFCRRFRGQEGDFRQSDLLLVALMIDLVRAVAGPQWRPARIELQSGGAHELRDCEAFGEAQVEVGRPATSITLPRALLSRALAPPAVSAAAVPILDARDGCGPPVDFLPSLEVVIGTLLESGRADLVTAAKAAGTSVRSFQRRLTELDASFSELVDRVRFRTASQLLEDSGVKIIDIALALGYSDPAHFTRAFRRWTSLTPLEYRRHLPVHTNAAQRSA